jgi:hypothetical protein
VPLLGFKLHLNEMLDLFVGQGKCQKLSQAG